MIQKAVNGKLKTSFSECFHVIDNIIAENIKKFDEVEFVVGISRGGLFPAAYVATKLDKPLVVAYIDKKDNVFFDRSTWIKNKRILVVDDIVRTGKTLNKIVGLLKTKKPKNVKTLTIYSLFSAKKLSDFCLLTTTDILFPWDKKIEKSVKSK